ncbi:MAG: ParB/RepB/Spo0J family partition protein, partial [Burkholderiales bacterium]
MPTDDGLYEVIDGFKRLGGWRDQGHILIPVVLERPSRTEEHKRLLLLANSPPRTLTALDEARVVFSLLRDEGLTQNTIARKLRRKPQWVARRVDLATRLSSTAQTQLAHGSMGPTLAHALCALPDKDQDALLGAIDRHRLKHREALVLLAAYRVADEPDRRQLLQAPLGLVRAEPAPSPATSLDTTQLEQRLEGIRDALVSLTHFTIPEHLAPAEQRRLRARLRSVRAQLHHTARALLREHATSEPQGDHHD